VRCSNGKNRLVSLKFVAQVRRSSLQSSSLLSPHLPPDLRVLKMSSVKKVAKHNGDDASSDGGGGCVTSPVASGSRQLQMTDMFKPRLTPSQEREQIGEKNVGG
jgi:hypothetical protein